MVCYSNATIQAIAIAFLPISSFAEFTESNINLMCYGCQYNSTSDKSIKKAAKRELALSFLKLTQCLDLSTKKTAADFATGKDEARNAHSHFRTCFESLVKLNSNTDSYEIGEQYDAHQYLMDLWRHIGIFPDKSFTFVRTIRCMQCEETRKSASERHWGLSLGLQNNDNGDFETDDSVLMTQLLWDHLKSTTKSTCDCPTCFEKCDHTIQDEPLAFFDAPVVDGKRFLYLQLKRYNNDATKNNTPVTFENDEGELTINDSITGRGLVFRAEAVIVHTGRTIKSGHYTTVGRKGIYDDSTVIFDDGIAFKELVLTGMLGDGGALGYIYFLVEVPPEKIHRFSEHENDDHVVLFSSHQNFPDNDIQILNRHARMLMNEVGLNGDLIDFQIRQLLTTTSRCFAFRSSDVTSMLQISYERVNIFDFDVILFPIGQNRSNKLICFVRPNFITPEEVMETDNDEIMPCILIMDSSINPQHYDDDVMKLKNFMYDEWIRQFDAEKKSNQEYVRNQFSNVQLVECEVPKNPNCYDSGTYVIMYVKLIVDMISRDSYSTQETINNKFHNFFNKTSFTQMDVFEQRQIICRHIQSEISSTDKVPSPFPPR